MFNKLEEIIKKCRGNVLAIGLDDKLLNIFDKNQYVNLFSINSNKKNNEFKKSKKKIINREKSINIKKLRKYINKKSINILICNMNEMIDYYKYFIKDSIYLNNGEIYIYSTNEIDKEFIINKYNRYNVKITSIDYKNGYIIKVDNTNGKNIFFKDKFYFIKDSLYNIAEFIGNILAS